MLQAVPCFVGPCAHVMSVGKAMKCCQDCVNRDDFVAAHSRLFGHRHLDRVIGPAMKRINVVVQAASFMLDDGSRPFENRDGVE